MIHPTAMIEDGVVIGRGTSVWDHVHVRREAVIGEQCIIGEKTYIAGGVSIGNRVKINAFVYICSAVTIEDGVMISAGTTFTNDRFPRATTPDLQALRASEPDEATRPTLGPRRSHRRRGMHDRMRSHDRPVRHGGDGLPRDAQRPRLPFGAGKPGSLGGMRMPLRARAVAVRCSVDDGNRILRRVWTTLPDRRPRDHRDDASVALTPGTRDRWRTGESWAAGSSE